MGGGFAIGVMGKQQGTECLDTLALCVIPWVVRTGRYARCAKREWMVTTMAELKPCPLCGSDDIRKITTVSHSKIWCSKCGVGLSRSCFGVYGSLAEAEKDVGKSVTNAWNRRFDPNDDYEPMFRFFKE
jgi:ribosomal protein L37AE/L43A